MDSNLLDKTIKILETIEVSKSNINSLSFEIETIGNNILSKEKEEVLNIKKKYKAKLNKEIKSIKAKKAEATKKLKDSENEREILIGKLIIKDRKDSLTDEEKETLDLLLQ